MGMIPQEVIDNLLDRLDIVEIISGYIQIKKSGRNFKACCPFHNEKTPSFVVSPDKQIYHCFGCAAGGNVISFVMKYENMEFPEAVKLLADGAGISLPETGRGSSPSLTGPLYEINQTAADFYHAILMSEEGRVALEYLKARGLDDKTLKTFMVGYAPNGWENFKTFCVKKKIPLEFARKAGLTIPSEKGKGDYDRFRNRIIFPIFSERGRVLGFGGRVLDNSLPKYINSPETPIYSKSSVLYGLNFSRQAIRDEKYVIITEGYLDVISSFKHGITNVVATSGTALTESQVVILKKYADTAVMVFDSDQAGEAASLRGLDTLLQNGMKVKIATLPEGEDPDSFVQKNGRKKFEKVIDEAKGLFDYKLDLLIKKKGSGEIGYITEEMLPTISKVNNAVVQSDYLRKLAERLGVDEISLRREMSKVKTGYSYRYVAPAEPSKTEHGEKSIEFYLLGLSISDKERYERIRDELGLDSFLNMNIRKAIGIIDDFYAAGEKKINPGKLLSRLRGDKAVCDIIVQALAKMDITSDLEKALSDCIARVRKDNRNAQLKGLNDRLKEAEKARDDEKITALLKEMSRLHKEKVI